MYVCGASLNSREEMRYQWAQEHNQVWNIISSSEREELSSVEDKKILLLVAMRNNLKLYILHK